MVTPWLTSASVVFYVTVAIGSGEDHEFSKNDSQIESHVAYELTYFVANVSNTTLKKCFCKADQVWDGSTCEEMGTLMVVIDYNTYNKTAVHTSNFGNVTIGEVTCPEGRKLEMNSEEEEFYILESGNLDFNYNSFDDYCIENVYGSHNLPNEFIAQICLETRVPACCPANYSLDVNGVCVASLNDESSLPPPDKTGRQNVRQKIEYRGVENITCSGREKLYIKNIDHDSVSLLYGPPKPVLEWKSPHTFKYHRIYDYCIGDTFDSEQELKYVAKFCDSDYEKVHEEKCKDRTCVRKCCDNSEVFNNGSCTYDESWSFQPVFHHPSNLTPGASEPKDLAIVNGLPLCPLYYPLEKEDDIYHLLQNGYLHSPGLPVPVPPSKYCLETFLYEDNAVRTIPLVCFPPKQNPFCTSLHTYLYPILLLISAGFLAVTLVVYVSVPELHTKVHGKCLISHVTTLLVAYLSLFTVQRISSTDGSIICKLMASVTHISFLAAFFWLNVMCFDIWWTLKSMHPVPETGEQSRLRFKLYSLYSWGCPIIIAIASVIIQSLPEEFDLIRPGFGESRCWFVDNKSQWVYFYGFVLVLVVINIIFFVHVAIILIVAHSDSVLQRTRQKNRERMWLYVKLFVVMGVTWLAETISWQEEICEAWIVTDIINSLQGLLIFLIFTCKRNLLKKMMSKCETFMRHLKDSVRSGRPSGSNKPTSGTGNAVSEQLSHSLSEIRSNNSATSHRTLRSQLSCESDSAIRKMSTGSVPSSMEVEVGIQDAIEMDPNAKSSNPKTHQFQISKDSVTLPMKAEMDGRIHLKIENEKEEDAEAIHNDLDRIEKTNHPEEIVEDSASQIP